jgi:L-lactate dehydrogenase complex protein LldF
MHGTSDHPTAAAAFIANRDRVRWHDTAVWFARTKRDRAAHGVPEWETLRELASKI